MQMDGDMPQFHFIILFSAKWKCGRRIVIVLDSGSGGPGSSHVQGHCIVFLGQTLHSHNAYLHPGVPVTHNAGGKL